MSLANSADGAQSRPVVRYVPEESGYASRFERRPEHLFNRANVMVVDARVRERKVEDLKVFSIADVFAGRDEIFFGFGTPNAYLVVPDGTGGYQKFAGKSLKRAPSVIQGTGARELVQSGIIVRFKNLPANAAERLRAAMQVHDGNKYWTCVNACLRIMEDAGFTLPDGRQLSSIYMPYSMMRNMLTIGLCYDGKPVELEVVRTSPVRMENYTLGIIRAELSTFRRHADRALLARAKTSKFFACVYKTVHFPARLWESVFGKKSDTVVSKVPVAPALPDEQEYCADIKVRVSTASFTGMLLRLLWGPHTLFEAQVECVKATDYFPGTLRPFPQANPSIATRLKKWILFSRPVIWFIREVLAPRYDEVGVCSEKDIYDMLRTDSPENPCKYNIVIAGLFKDGKCCGTRIIIARTTVAMGLVDWVLSKHVLVSGYDHYVVFAGEDWKDVEGTIHLNRNSGTYQPSEEELDQAVRLVQAVLPNLRVVKDALPS